MSTPRTVSLPAGVERVDVTTTRGLVAALVVGPEDSPHPVVVLVPGWTGSKEDFLTLLAELARTGRRAIAFDQRGQFETPGPDRPEDYSLASFAADAAAVAAAVSDRPVDLVGHSFGGLVAAQCAVDSPDVCSSLTLLCSGLSALPPDRHAHLTALDAALSSVGAARAWRAMRDHDRAAGLLAPPPAIEAWLERRFLTTSPASLRSMTRLLTEAPDLRQLVRSRPVPTLVLTTEHDDGWPVEDQLAMAADIGAESVVLEGLGHSPAVDDPAATAGALVDFWTRWAPTPALLDIVLHGGTGDVPQARHLLRDTLSTLDGLDEEWLFSAELLTSELVTNAVLHGTPPIRLRAEARGGHLVLRAHDAGSGVTATSRVDYGRGLGVVATLAHRCGGWTDPDGTTAWFWLPMAQPSSPRCCTTPMFGSSASHDATAGPVSMPSGHESR